MLHEEVDDSTAAPATARGTPESTDLEPLALQLARFVVKSSPLIAAVLELVLLPATLLASQRLSLLVGTCFHVLLAVPLPPSSFYPFSMVCLALFALLLPIHRSTQGVDIVNLWLGNLKVNQFATPLSPALERGVALGLVVAVFTAIFAALRMPF